MLVEALAGVGIAALCAGAALAAVAAVTHSAAHELARAALRVTAQNVLADLRAATAYDPSELAGLAGRSISFPAAGPGTDCAGSPVTVSVRVGASEAGRYPATVDTRAADGTSVTLNATLSAEVPAPGTIDAPSSPQPDAPAASPAAADTLAL